jgi:hypothetical protein
VERVRADDPDRGRGAAEGGPSVMAVADQDERLDLIDFPNREALAFQQKPNLFPSVSVTNVEIPRETPGLELTITQVLFLYFTFSQTFLNTYIFSQRHSYCRHVSFLIDFPCTNKKLRKLSKEKI